MNKCWLGWEEVNSIPSLHILKISKKLIFPVSQPNGTLKVGNLIVCTFWYILHADPFLCPVLCSWGFGLWIRRPLRFPAVEFYDPLFVRFLPSLLSWRAKSINHKAGWELQSSLVTQMVKNPPAILETWVRTLGWEDPLEKGKATHSRILAWRIPWTEDPGRLQSMGLQRIRHNWVINTHTHA